MEYTQHAYREAPDTDGKQRKPIVFHLRPVGTLSPDSAVVAAALAGEGPVSGRGGRGGFGSVETNRRVEKAAIEFVRGRYEEDGWTVRSVEAQKVGYDLCCERGNVQAHLEVKGTQGDDVCFIVTAAEVRNAMIDRRHLTCVVTAALTPAPKMFPNEPLPSAGLAGPKFGWLNALKASIRNSKPIPMLRSPELLFAGAPVGRAFFLILMRTVLVAIFCAFPSLLSAADPTATAAIVHVDTAHPIKTFDPDLALGSSIDILPPGVVDKIYTPAILKESLSAGWGPITYRQNTELQGGAWHWNPSGSWSDPAHQSGYFTGASEPKEFIRHSYGYPLPHRGNTHGDGRSRSRYSRLTDGDPGTYWKSNPYLTSRFTREDDSLHPQWVIVDLGAAEKVDTLRIEWADPYARQYAVQYWSGEKEPLDNPTAGTWIALGIMTGGRGGLETLNFTQSFAPVRYLRIWMTQSSGTTSPHDPKDPRSSAGYAIREIYAGTVTQNGEFVDLIKHVPDQGQTATRVSSVDPWHSAADLDMTAGDQTGMDLFYTSGITNNLPAMIPVSMLYGTPEDATAQIAYVKKRGYPISYIEMGEEPDGQKMLPEDYGALYLQFATALHKVDPNLKLGGPVFEGVNEDIQVWPDAKGRVSWLGRFLDYLKEHGRLSDLSFVSFEHYPFPPCGITWSDLYREPELTEGILKVWRADGVPQNVPLINTESNVSWGLTQPMTDIFAALWLADSVGSFLTLGGDVYYHSPIQPEPLRSGCRGWSTYGNFVADENLQIKAYTSQYFASRLINLEWVKHGAGMHSLFPAVSALKDTAGHILVTAYAVRRPDGEWSLMLVNKDQSNPHAVRIVFDNASGGEQTFSGPVTMVTFGSDQYVWRSEGPNSHPDPNNPPVTTTAPGGAEASFTLPKASVTVLRGKAEAGR